MHARRRPRAVLPPLLLALAGLAGCQRGGGGGGDGERLAALDKRLAELDGRLDKLEGFLGPYLNQPPPPPEPDPAVVYAVPVEGAAYEGPEVAPVTIVEAFEFA